MGYSACALPNQIQPSRKSYDTPDRDALALYGQLKVGASYCAFVSNVGTSDRG